MNTTARRPHPVLRPGVRATALALAALAAQAAQAQSTPEVQRLERVEVTGSSIKRIEGETALPVQVIRREDIDKMLLSAVHDMDHGKGSVREVRAFSQMLVFIKA